MKRWLIIFLTLPLFTMLHAQSRHLSLYEYWLDDDYDNRTSQSLSQSQENINFSIDASDMIMGMHTISLHVQDSEGNWSGIVRSSYLVFDAENSDTPSSAVCEYWIDGTYDQRKTAGISNGKVAFAFDASTLVPGMHNICCRVLDSNGNASGIVRANFFVRPEWEKGTGKIVSCEYWIDGDRENTKEIAISTTDIAFAIDASELGEGGHSVSMRLKNDLGEYSSILNDIFFKFSTEAEAGTPVTCEYWIDKDFVNKKQVAVANDGSVAFIVNASQQIDGMHQISWRILDDKGNYSAINSSSYYKYTPELPAEDIVWYQYWWNDRSDKGIRKEVTTKGELSIENIFEVPDYVAENKDMEAGTAEFHILFANNQGIISSIVTEVVTDKIPPVSSMEPLPETQVTNMQILSWGGTDKWAGVKDYTVYVYDEMEEQWKVFIENTTETSIPYYCSMYDYTAKFFVIARDSMDNVEPMKTESETEIRFMYVDIYPPTTTTEVSSTNVEVGESVELSWYSTDDVNEVKNNIIYYSEDGGPWILWKTVTDTTSITFKGRKGATYKFIVTGQDSEGNKERPDISKAVSVHFNN